MSELYQRGVDLLVDVQDAFDHIDQVTPQEVQQLFKEVSEVLGQMLEREAGRHDMPRQKGLSSKKPAPTIQSGLQNNQ